MRAAEWVLGLVTTPERAASIAGDLWESRTPGGVARFWLDVLRIVASLVWQDVVTSPGQILKLALRAFVWEFLYVLLFGMAIGVAAGSLFGWLGLDHPHRLWSSVNVCSFLAFAVIQFKVGRWIAHNAEGREVAVWLIKLAFPLVLGIVGSVVWSSPYALNASYPLLELVSLAAVVGVRRNRGVTCEIQK